MKPHGESAKEILAEAEDSDEEPEVPTQAPVNAQKQTSSGWSKHVGHAASAKYGVDAAKPVLPSHKSPEKIKAEITPEITEKSEKQPFLQPENKMKFSPQKQSNDEIVPPLPPASIPISSSNGLQILEKTKFKRNLAGLYFLMKSHTRFSIIPKIQKF